MMPNFLGLGAAKAGTTSIRYYLKEHPGIFVASGEPRFFSFEGEKLDPRHVVHKSTITDLASYQELFSEVNGETAVGDISPSYLFNPRAPGRIKEYIPDAKMFALLRNPVDRAFSHFMHMVKSGHEPELNFRKALAESEVKVGQWNRTRYYIPFGFYHQQLQRYYALFDRDQLRVYLFDDLIESPLELVQDLYRFLAVDDSFVPDVEHRLNPSGIPRNRTLQNMISRQTGIKNVIRSLIPKKYDRGVSKFVHNIQKWNLRKEAIPQEMRYMLLDIYREDILRLQCLIDRDLSKWLEVK